MKKIVHISDLHFGRANPTIIATLLSQCIDLKPDILIISGDLTQRARIEEFTAAQEFIQALESKGIYTLTIPGNHDIRPLYSPIKRVSTGYDRYDQYIRPITNSEFRDSEIGILGINTVRPLKIAGGSLSKKDTASAQKWFVSLPSPALRMVVTHHPLDLPSHYPKRKLATQAEQGIYELAQSKVALYLSGHYHRASTVTTKERYSQDHFAAIALQAGTVSNRIRGESQSFNVLTVEHTSIAIIPYIWDVVDGHFLPKETFSFIYLEEQWKKE